MEPAVQQSSPVAGPSPFSAPVLSPSSKKNAPLDDRTRLKRNASEKKRRDKLNTYIHELSAMVPSCSMPQSQRKLDKSTILKLTVSYMKLHADLLPECADNKNLSWKPAFLSNEELGQLMLEALDGFLFVISYTGQIVYMSESITPLLGHLQSDLVGKDFLSLLHPEDILGVQEKMFPPQPNRPEHGYIEELGALAPSPASVPSPGSIPSPGTAPSAGPSHLRRQFQCRMRKGAFPNKPAYEMVYCSGHVRKWSEVVRNTKVEGEPDPFPQEGTCLVGVGRLQSTQTIREMSPSVPPKNEWTSQHSMDAKYLFIDDRAASIIGYSSAELLGSNGYNFYHHEDLRALSQCHIDLNMHGIGTTCYYRFLTKGQQWLWIQTKGTVVYKNGSKTPSFVVTNNTVVSYAQVWEYLQKRSKQYGPDTPTSSPLSLTAPQQAVVETKPEIMPLEEIKIESPYSPAYNHQLQPPQSLPSLYNTTSYYADMPPADTLIFPKKLAPKAPYNIQPQAAYYPTDKPESSTYYNPVVEKAEPEGFNTQGATFAELYPNYKPSISTHETHGTYKQFKPLNHQPYTEYHPPTTKPPPPQVYHQPAQPPPQQFNPAPAPTNHYMPPTTNYVTTTTNFIPNSNVSTSNSYPASTMNYSTTNYSNSSYTNSYSVQPNVAVSSNGTPGCDAQPVLGKAVPQQHPAQHPVYLNSSSPPPKKGVSVYGGEKRCLSNNMQNSCAQVEYSAGTKRPRSDPPQYLPPYIKPANCYTQPCSYQQPMVHHDNLPRHDNNLQHHDNNNLQRHDNNNNHHPEIVQNNNYHIKNGAHGPVDTLVSIDTGQLKVNIPH